MHKPEGTKACREVKQWRRAVFQKISQQIDLYEIIYVKQYSGGGVGKNASSRAADLSTQLSTALS
jgi:hypothetical protein